MIRLIQAAFIDMENMFDLLDEKVEVSYLWFTTLIEPSIVVWRVSFEVKLSLPIRNSSSMKTVIDRKTAKF